MPLPALAVALLLSIPRAAAEDLPFLETSASSGPIQITLRILNRPVAVNGIPYFNIEVRNLGTKRIFLAGVFSHPEWISSASKMKHGTRLEMQPPDGREPLAERGDDVQVSPSARRPTYRKPPKPKAVILEAGASAPVLCGGKKLNVADRDWCPMGYWFFGEPGIYRIRAIYDSPHVVGTPQPQNVTVATPWIPVRVIR